MRTRIWLLIFALTILGACIERYFPDIDEYLDLPVVEGTITNEPGPYIIRLSRSVALDNMDLKPLRGAHVIISDDSGSEEILTESEPGIYLTSPSGIRGEIGKKYRITVETGGTIYQSVYETILEPVAIDTIYTNLEYREIAEGPVEGLQFYVDTKVIPDQICHFLWTYSETYKFRSEFRLDYIYFSKDSIVRNYSDSGSMCWQTEKSFESFTFSARNHGDTRVAHFPLQYVNNLTNKLSERYSAEVYQHTISDAAYQYWNEIEKQQLGSGSIYSRQPYQIQGNVKNTENPDEIVLGYFMAAGVDKKRIYVDPPPVNFNFNTCTPAINLFQTSNPYELTYPLFAMVLTNGDYAFAHLSCFDCRMKGGTMTEPEFWEEFNDPLR